MTSGATSPLAQPDVGVRFEWGLSGALALADPTGAVVIVDVLSFTTSVTIATDRGTTVYPHPLPATDLDRFASAHDAVLAVRRRDVTTDDPWSLSPTHLLAAPPPERLVLPSPNGSTIAATVSAAAVVAGCLRNATAVAAWLTAHEFGRLHRPVAVIAAGERWPDGELRPALEDLLGAGAVIAALPAHATRSPEAAAAAAVWDAHRQNVTDVMARCATGLELAAAGFASDVTIAAEHDAQRTVPILSNGAFRPAGRPTSTPG
jgi:2-phosphosulfolactate phosphatase